MYLIKQQAVSYEHFDFHGNDFTATTKSKRVAEHHEICC